MIFTAEEEKLIDEIITRALDEDGVMNDITSAATIPLNVRGRGYLIPREEGVVAGLPVAEKVFKRVHSALIFTPCVEDGARVSAGTELAHIEGPVRSMLSAERLALNLLQRLSGIATQTRRFVDAVSSGSRTKILDTRKTMPNLRVLDRYAVRMGGGTNHRWNLSTAYLIKDNHIAASGGIAPAIEAAKKNHKGENLPWIEVEVDCLDGVREAVKSGVDRLLLDNFTNEMVAEAIHIIGDRCEIEVSGRMTLDRIWSLSSWGVNFISVGALTHSVKALDIGLDIHEHPEFKAQIKNKKKMK